MLQGFLSGMTSYLAGLRLIAKYHLWLYFWVPVLLSLLLGALVLRTAWAVSDDIGGWLISYYPWEWGADVIEKIANVLSGVLIVVLTLMIFRYLIMAVASPFMSLLSEKLEVRMYPGRPPVRFSIGRFFSDLIRGITIALRNVIRELFFTLILLLLGVIIPILGPIVPIIILLIQAYYAGFGNMDFTLERHLGVRESVRFVRNNRWLALGNGLVFVLMLMTVVGFLFALPLGTAAAALVTLERLEE
ncbi:MAG: EI24 domain-containing protein [Lewinella sp.]|nr:EI24 domain-containing protein [Lewinella sp.]